MYLLWVCEGVEWVECSTRIDVFGSFLCICCGCVSVWVWWVVWVEEVLYSMPLGYIVSLLYTSTTQIASKEGYLTKLGYHRKVGYHSRHCCMRVYVHVLSGVHD